MSQRRKRDASPTELMSTQGNKRRCNVQRRDSRILDEEDVWEVEKIVGVETFDGNKFYRVRWKNFTAESDTWEPYKNLLTCKDLVNEYLTRKRHQEALLRSPIPPAKVALLDSITYKTVGDSKGLSIDITATIKYDGEEGCTAWHETLAHTANAIHAKLLKDETVRQWKSRNFKRTQNCENFVPEMRALTEPVPAKKPKLSVRMNPTEKNRLTPIMQPLLTKLESQGKPSKKPERRPAEKFQNVQMAKTTPMEKPKITPKPKPTEKTKLALKATPMAEVKLTHKNTPMAEVKLTQKNIPMEKTKSSLKTLTTENAKLTSKTKRLEKTKSTSKATSMSQVKLTQKTTPMVEVKLTQKTTPMEKTKSSLKSSATEKAKLTSKTKLSEKTKATSMAHVELTQKITPMEKTRSTPKTAPMEKTTSTPKTSTTEKAKLPSKTKPLEKTKLEPIIRPTDKANLMLKTELTEKAKTLKTKETKQKSETQPSEKTKLAPKIQPTEKANLMMKTQLMEQAKALETKLKKETKQKSETQWMEKTEKFTQEMKPSQKTTTETKPMHDIRLKSETSSVKKKVIVETVEAGSFPADSAYDTGVVPDSSGDCSSGAVRSPVPYRSPPSSTESSSLCSNSPSPRTAKVATVIESESGVSGVTDFSDWVKLDGHPVFKSSPTEGLDDTSSSEESRNDLLMHAVKTGDNATVQAIFAGNGVCDVEQANERGTTLLMKALLNFHEDVVETLLSKGANPNARHSNGATPLIIAIRSIRPNNKTQASSCDKGNIRSIAALLKTGARVNVCDENGDSALVKACGRGDADIVRRLLLNGANFVPAVTLACKFSLEVRQCLERHAATVRDEFQAKVDVYLNQKAKIIAQLFPIHCFCPSYNDTYLDTQLDVMFKQSELNVSNMQPGAGNLLFLAHSEFNSESVSCRLSGPCIVLNVTLNGMRQLPLVKNCNFVYKLSSIRVGENKLKIFTVPSEKPSVKLVVSAYNAQLPT